MKISRFGALPIILTAMMGLAGCEGERVSGVKPLVGTEDSFGNVDDSKIVLFDDQRLARLISGEEQGKPHPIEAAVDKFEKNYKDDISKEEGTTKSDIAYNKYKAEIKYIFKRNSIQDAILFASVEKCNEFKRALRQDFSNASFVTSALSTTLGGVGAIVTGRDASRTFAGLSGVVSGGGAAWNQSYFASIATSVIAPGIDKRRIQILNDIMNKRCDSVETYTVMLALADATQFHGACTMDVGIAEAGKAVQAASDPGLSAMEATLDHYQTIQAKMAKIASTDTSGRTKPATGTTTQPPAAPVVTKDAGTAQTTVTNPSSTDQPKTDSSVYTTIEGLKLPTTCDPRLVEAKAPAAQMTVKVYFDTAGKNIDADTTKEIQAAADAYAKGDYGSIQIVGKTDGVDSTNNKQISEDRAKAVQAIFDAELKEKNKADPKYVLPVYSVTGVGSSQPEIPGTAGKPEQANRVVIITLGPKATS